MAKRKRRKKKKKGKKFSSNFGSAVTKNAQRKKQEQSGYGYLNLPNNMPIFKAEENTKPKLDFIPYIVSDENHPDRYDEEGIATPGTLWYKRPFAIHRQVGVDNDTVVCPRSVSASDCPICDYRESKLRSGEAEWDDDAIRQTKPSNRNLYVVIPIGSKEHDEVPHIFDISEYCYQELLYEELEERPEMGVFPSLDEGLTLKIRFAEESIGDTSFPIARRIDFYERDRPYDESLLEDIPDLDEMLRVLSVQELEAKFFEISESDYADDYEEEPAQKTDRRSKSETRSEAEEDWQEDEYIEEDEFEDEFEDEEFEDEFEDEEEWFDEEDEFEEEPEPEPKKKPKRKKKKSKKKKKRKRKK